MDFGSRPPTLSADDVEAYADAVRRLPGSDADPAFPPATPANRDDPHNAYVTPLTAESASEGPLSDLSVAVKDNLAVRGVPTTAGTDVLAVRPEGDATVVERLRRAAATLTGTTNMDALALGTTGEWSAHGRTENPAASGRVPGGSSSGSAAAVAGGLVDAALGTDTGGSVRIPASFTGVVGVKPTYGLVSRRGLAPLAPSLDHVGVLASDVATAAAVLETVAGADIADPATFGAPSSGAVDLTSDLTDRPSTLWLGVVEEFVEDAAAEVRSTVREAVSAVGERGDVTVRTVSLPDYETATLVNDAQTVMEFAALLGWGGHLPGTGRWLDAGLSEALAGLRRRGVPVNDRARRLIHLGRDLLCDDGPSLYGRTWAARRRVAAQVASAFDGVDALVTPTTPTVAPAFGAVPDEVEVRDTLRNTAPFNDTGHPSVSVPCGSADGRPVGLQVTTPLGADALALRVARAVEAVTGVDRAS